MAEEEEDGTFSDSEGSEGQPTAPWKAPGQNIPGPKTHWTLKGEAGQLGVSEEPLCVKAPGKDLGQPQHSLRFWGLPSLHSESIVATLLVPLGSYSLEPHLVLFNGVCKAVPDPVLDHGSPALPQPLPVPLTFVHAQPQTVPFSPVPPQAHMQSPLSPMQSSVPHGRPVRTRQNRTVSEVLNGSGHLQYHLLQNHPAHLWGVVPECHCEPVFGLLVPSFPSISQPSQAYVSIPRTGHFHFNSGTQNNLEPYGPHSQVPSWHYQPCIRTGVPEAVDPQSKPTGTSPHDSRCAKPQRSVHWSLSCSDIRTGEPSQSESFCEQASMQPQLRKDVAKNLGQILGKCPLDNPQVISECYVLNTLGVVPKAEQDWAGRSRTGWESQRLTISRKSLNQRHTRSILRLHMDRKLWQITAGRVPVQVCRSWLAEDLLPWDSLGNVYCNAAIPRIPFLDHKTQKMLEAHLIRFRMSQKWDLPLKVIESIKSYLLREAKTWPLPQSDCPSPSNSTSESDLKDTFPPPLRGSSNLFHEDKIERDSANSASIIDLLPLTVPHADGEGGEPLRQLHSSPAYEVTEMVQIAEGDRPSNVDSTSRDDAEPHGRPKQEPPAKDRVAESEWKNGMARSSSHLEIPTGEQKVERDPMYRLTPRILSEILRAPEVSTLLAGSASSGKFRSSTEEDEDRNKLASSLVTEHNPSRARLPEDPALLDFKKLLLRELKLKLENQSLNQTESYESNVSLTTGSLTGYSPSSSNSVSSADISVSRDFHAHLHNPGISLELWQKPRAFKYILRNLTPAEIRPASPVPRGENGSRETTGLETSKAGRKGQPSKGKSDHKPHPPEGYFRRKIGQFFQWLHSSKDSARHRSEKDRALFLSCGPPEAHELMASLGKLLEDKLLCGQKSEFSEWGQRKWLKPTKGQPSIHGEGESSCCCPQTYLSSGPSQTLGLGQRHAHISFGQQSQLSYMPSPEARDP